MSNLKRMRKFYITFQNGGALRHQLSWSHYRYLLPLKSTEEINYYINIAIAQNLSYRDLQKRIKSNEYERIGYKEELEKPKINTLIKEPIIIKTPTIPENITEYTLHNLILEDLDNFLKELGIGFMYSGHEVKIKIGNNYHYIDFLLFNVKYNRYVVVEIKVTKFHENYIGQVQKYMSYVDKHIKEYSHDKTIGIIICKENNKLVLNYINPEDIYVSTYELTN